MKIRGSQIKSKKEKKEKEEEEEKEVDEIKYPNVEQSIPQEYQNENLSVLVE